MASRLHAYPRLLDRRWPDDLAIAGVDAAGVGDRGGAIRLYWTPVVGTLRQTRFAHDRASRRDQHFRSTKKWRAEFIGGNTAIAE